VNQFTISDIESLSGIKAHTLRIWEQRYRILKPKRKESKHRLYDNEDLKHILRIAHLNKKGIKISKIAGMSEDQIELLALEHNAENFTYENFIAQMIEAALDFDENRFNQVFHTIFVHIGMEKTVTRIFYPILERIGTYWMVDNTRPVQEHFVSCMIAHKLMIAIDGIPLPQGNGPVTILFTPQSEHHEIPLLFIHYLLKKKGKRCVFVGANTAIDTMKEYAASHQADVLHFHFITNLSSLEPNDLAMKMIEQFPGKKIVISGPLSRQVTVQHSELLTLRSMQELMDYCNQ
jgi:DNA-binding transcriptional MerR regulator